MTHFFSEPSKPNFSTLESKTTDVSRLPGCFMQLENMSVKVIDQEVVTRWKESVGQIRSSSYFATAFRVGPDYIMTAKHVLDGILDSGLYQVRNESRLEDIMWTLEIHLTREAIYIAPSLFLFSTKKKTTKKTKQNKTKNPVFFIFFSYFSTKTYVLVTQ